MRAFSVPRTRRSCAPLVSIGAPVRDREWCLPAYLTAIHSLSYPRERIRLVFILNDSNDGSEQVLLRFMETYCEEYDRIMIIRHDRDQIKDERTYKVRQCIFHSLAVLRNILVEYASESDYLFSIDTDILVPPRALSQLMAHRQDIVSGFIWNDTNRSIPNLMIEKHGLFRHVVPMKENSLFLCDVTGAVSLISNAALRNTRYGYHPQGEDVAFCVNAKRRGHSIYCDRSLECVHLLNRDEFVRHLPREACNPTAFNATCLDQMDKNHHIPPVPHDLVMSAEIDTLANSYYTVRRLGQTATNAP